MVLLFTLFVRRTELESLPAVAVRQTLMVADLASMSPILLQKKEALISLVFEAAGFE